MERRQIELVQYITNELFQSIANEFSGIEITSEDLMDRFAETICWYYEVPEDVLIRALQNSAARRRTAAAFALGTALHAAGIQLTNGDVLHADFAELLAAGAAARAANARVLQQAIRRREQREEREAAARAAAEEARSAAVIDAEMAEE